MTEQQILDIISREFRALGLPSPVPDRRHLHTREATAWLRAARRIQEEALTDQRRAARTASMVGAAITRGRTSL